MTGRNNPQASRGYLTTRCLNRMSKKEKPRTKASVPVEQDDPSMKILKLEARVEALKELGAKNLRLLGDSHQHIGSLLHDISILQKEKEEIADTAATIDFIAYARKFVEGFERRHLMNFPKESAFVSEVQKIFPSFPNSHITQGDRSRKIFWILLQAPELKYDHLRQLRDYLDRSNDRYLTFSCAIQSLFEVFSSPLHPTSSCKFSSMSKQEIYKFTDRLLPELKSALRTFLFVRFSLALE